MVDVIRSFNPMKRLAFFASLLLLLGLFVSLSVWVLYPKQQTLFAGLDENAAAEAIAYLEERDVPYNISESGNGHAIQVEEEQVDRLKVTMQADLGLPEVKGLELFDNSDYSMTDFSQEVTYKRALQGELARTVSAMPGIRNARVHITFAPKTLFSASQEQAKASVFIEEQPETLLDEAQVSAIQVLVANSVERLEAPQVAVFGAQGVELSNRAEAQPYKQVDKQYEAKYEVEQRLTAKAYKLLSLAVSPENIAVSVDVTLDFDQRKKMTQGYIANAEGEGVILRKKESTVAKENNNSRSVDERNTISSESEQEYQHGRETEETIFSSGKIKSINAAVALRADLTAEQVEQIRDLLSTGLGISAYRGDRISVAVLAPLAQEPSLAAPSIPQGATSESREATQNIEKSQHSAELFTSNMNWQWLWLLVLLVVPGVWFIHHQRTQGLKRREQLLIEVSQWLEQGEGSYEKRRNA